ncbi:MAG: NADH-quinone oxidoreductase subunit J [Verrucomicrobiae bacterium]|nr:NADH-quinone oxidoreductase subunit J [Verrucomicrobiae bacterium]MDW7980694.1 NADH-quinone oxidoreductase subunit J [Verrucomicrobiales bacterium]
MSTFPALDHLVRAVFALAVLATVSGALVAVLSARIIRSVAGLALCCVGLAGLYYFLHAPFLALMEILIYVGAVCVTIVFAVMLAEPDEPPAREPRCSRLLWGAAALVCSAAAFVAIGWAVFSHPWPAPAPQPPPDTVRGIGTAFLTTHALAFELVSVVLVVGILGALVVARLGRGRG